MIACFKSLSRQTVSDKRVPAPLGADPDSAAPLPLKAQVSSLRSDPATSPMPLTLQALTTAGEFSAGQSSADKAITV